MNSLLGTYAGLVEKTNDPEGLGRVKVRVPHVYGVSGSGTGYIGVNDLPWALPAGMPAGGSGSSGGFSMIPDIGDKVWVRFLDGEPEKPIYEWGMQSIPDAKKLKLHKYAKLPTGGIGAPDRSILSRYGHSLEFTKETVTLTTEQGYQLRLENSGGETGGSAAIVTKAGQKVSLSDLGKSVVIQGLDSAVMSAKSVALNAAANASIKAAGSLTLMIGGTLVIIKGKTLSITTGTGATLIIDANGNIAIMSAGGASISIEQTQVQVSAPDGTSMTIENGKVSVSTTQMVLNTGALAVGADAQYPALMLTPATLAWFLTHTHTNGNEGSPTGPPILTFPTEAASTRMQLT